MRGFDVQTLNIAIKEPLVTYEQSEKDSRYIS